MDSGLDGELPAEEGSTLTIRHIAEQYGDKSYSRTGNRECQTKVLKIKPVS